MEPKEIKKGIYWVGAIDWDLRNFHGYLTQKGSTYNSYLIVDEKITLVDTVKSYKFNEMLERISKICDPSKIDYIVSNHVEMDHTGSMPEILKIAKNAKVITSQNGEKGLRAHFKKDWDFKVVKTGDVLNLGKRNIHFVLTPMVHWPDSMVSYIPEEKLLLPNDAFGQHIASSSRFDDEVEFDILMHEAAKYYANIVLPYGKQVNAAMQTVLTLDIDMIAPSHGVIWRKNINEIVKRYQKWANNETVKKAVIIYDTMWGSTEKIAYTLNDVFTEKKYEVVMCNLQANHISDVITQILDAEYICIGSPTLNNNMLPTVASFITYLKGLAPKNRFAIAFGSFGWGGQSVKQIYDILNESKFNCLTDPIKCQYIPGSNDLKKIKDDVLSLI